jgi:hypothetical protein
MAADPEAAEHIFRVRFGEIVRPCWQGASRAHRFTAFPFGSWLCEENRLTVFYGLPHNGELAGDCQAFETDREVIVSLRVLVPRGARTFIGGFKPSYARSEPHRAAWASRRH